MLEIRERASELSPGHLTLCLPFQDRQRSRLRVTLSSDEEAALLMQRGTVLRGGDALQLSDGRCVLVVAATEQVSTVRSLDLRALTRVAYHLGNRHVALEIGSGYVRYLHDHVLDEMVRELGLEVAVEHASFEPEAGAYGKGHSHGHSHEHSHSHGDSHDRAHGADHTRVLDGRRHVQLHAHDRTLTGEGADSAPGQSSG